MKKWIYILIGAVVVVGAVVGVVVGVGLGGGEGEAPPTFQLKNKWGSAGSGDGQFSYPMGIAIGPQGNIYVADSGNNRIQIFDSQGNFIAKWGIEGYEDGQLDGPRNIAVDSQGNVYVTDGTDRVQKFDSQGNSSWASGFGPSTEEGHFWMPPTAIAVDSQGNVYVPDHHVVLDETRIQMFDSEGEFITKWGSSGSGDGEFSSPSGIAVDGQGNIYVADSGNNRIQVFELV